jgi:Outer membrane protein beta-barrel domain
MKRIKYIAALAVLIIIASVSANAQQKGILKLDLNYNYSIPLGSFKNDLISDASPRGVTGAFMYGINNKWSAGVQFGYQDYYQKYPRAVYKTGDNEETSAVLTNSIQAIPVIAKATYKPLARNNAFIQPYISAGAGISMIDFKQYLGEFGSQNTSGAFTAQAGAGIMVPFSKGGASGFSVGADYNYVSYKKFGYENMNNLSLHAGVHFPLR